MQKRSVRRCRGVMELVDDHDVEMRRVQRLKPRSVQALDRREDVFEARGSLSAHPELAEAHVAKSKLERRAALSEDLRAMGDEQEPVSRELITQARVVDCSDDGLAGSGCGDEEIAMAPDSA